MFTATATFHTYTSPPYMVAVLLHGCCSALYLQAPFDGFSSILLEVKSNLKELTASIQTHSSNRSYARMQSDDEMLAVVEKSEQEISSVQGPFSGSFDDIVQSTSTNTVQ